MTGAGDVGVPEPGLRALCEGTSDLVGVCGPDGDLQYLNPAARGFLGIAPDTPLAGRSGLDFVPGRERERARAAAGAAAEAGSWQGRLVMADAHGREVPVAQVVVAQRDAEGHVRCFVAAARDLSDLYTAQAQLGLERDRFRSLVEHSGDVTTVVDEDGRFAFVSPNARTVLGFDPEELSGRPATTHIVEEDVAAMAGAFRRSRLGGHTGPTRFHLRDPGGRIRTIEALLTNRLDDPGVRGVVMNCRDITDRESIEAALRASEERFRALAEASPVGVFQLDARGELVYSNRRWHEIVGLEDEERSQHRWGSEIHSDDIARVRDVAQHAFENEEPYHAEHRVVRPNGEVRWIDSRAVPTRDRAGRLTYVGTVDDISERKELEAALWDSQSRFRSLADASPVGIYQVDEHGRHVYGNPRWYELNGLADEIRSGTEWGFSVHPGDQDLVAHAALRAYEERSPMSVRHRVRRPDGEERWVRSKATALFDGGRFRGWVGTLEDVTEDVRTRGEADRLLSILEATPDLAGIADPRGHLLYLNRSAREFFEVSDDADLATLEARRFVDREKLADVEMHAEGARDFGTRLNIETTVVGPSGREVPVSLVGTVHLDEDGAPKYFSVIARDISGLKAIERKLVESEAWYRSLLQHATDIVTVHDADGTMRHLSPSAEQILGWTQADLEGVPYLEFVYPADVDDLVETTRSLLAGPESPVRVEFRARNRAGEWRDLEARVTNLLADPVVHGVVTNASDVTERKEAERALARSEGALRALVQHAPMAIELIDREGVVRFWSRSGKRMFGWTADEVVGRRGPLPFLPEEVREETARIHDRVLAGESVVTESRRLHKDGTSIDVSVRGAPLRDTAGEVTSIILVTADVTDRKEAEAALRASEERFRMLVQSSADLTVLFDAEWRITYASPSAREFLGESLAELIEAPAEDSWVHPDDLERVNAEFDSLRAEPGTTRRTEFRVRRGDGSWRWLELVAANQLHHPAVEGIITNAFDVTERVEAAANLSEVNERLRHTNDTLSALVESSPLAIAVLDRHGRVELWNPAAAALYSWPAEEVIGRPDPTVPDERADEQERLRADVLHGRSVTALETVRGTADGRLVDVSLSVAPINDEVGRLSSWMVVSADITERKRAEAAVRVQDERFRSLVQNASDVVSILRPDGSIRYVTPAIERVLGYSERDVVGRSIFHLLHPDEIERATRLLEKRTTEGWHGVVTEHRVRAADGSWRHVETTAVDLVDDAAVQGIVLTTRDVSERHEAQEALRQSEERFRALVQNAADVICVVGSDGAVKYLSPSVEKVFGPETSFESYDDPWDRIHPDDLRPVLSAFETLWNGGSFQPIRYRVQHVEHGWRVVESVAEDLRDDPAVGGLVIWSRDVTERTVAEEALRASEARFRVIVQDQTEVIARWRDDGTFAFVNEAAAQFLGTPIEEFEGASVFDYTPGDFKLALRRRMHELEADEVTHEELPIRPADGSTRWLRWTVRALEGPDERREFQAVGVDVTERRRAEEFGAEQARILEMVARGVSQAEVFDALCRMLEAHVSDARVAILTLDEGTGQLRHAAAPHIPGELVALVDEVLAGSDEPDAKAMLREQRAVEPPDAEPDSEPEVARAARRCGVGDWAIPIRTSSGDEVLGAVVVYLSSTVEPEARDQAAADVVANLASIAIERVRAEAELTHQALHDPLTGLPNRALFSDRLSQALARARRSGTSCAVLFLDLDRFKTINDSLGHDTGDELLVAVARRLEAVVRPGDTVARFGGDEFTILLEELADPHGEAQDLAERVLSAVNRPFPLVNEEEAFLTASIGIAVAEDAHRRPKTLLRDADAAMYRAKERGKARYEVFDEAMRATAVQRLETETALHRALDRNEFEVFYQPIVSLRDAQCVGAEALVRWHHPERGLVTPSEFVGLAEETGLIVPLGLWVLEEACARAARWESLFARAGTEPFFVTVNLSARQFANPSLVDQVRAAIDRSGVAPRSISLEITESVLMDDADATMRALAQLEGLGVRLGVDDFGTGYSSLGYLKRLPVGMVKVDRSFVSGLGREPEDAAIVAAVVSLAEALGLHVVAEGVETSSQLTELLGLGCDLAQGYFFAPPQPAPDLESLLERGRRWRPPGTSVMQSVDSLEPVRRRRRRTGLGPG